MNIGLDVMGGDYAPAATVAGAILAKKELPTDVVITLIGDDSVIIKLLKEKNQEPKSFNIIKSENDIEMKDNPATAFSKKQKSSMALGFGMLAANKIQGFCSAGNSGAAMVGALYSVKQIPGIIRPCISIKLPRPDGSHSVLLDVGINPDCKPDVLYQYGIIGSVYSKNILKVDNPKVGLLNIGGEAKKGNLLTKATYEIMQDSADFNFTGNIEPNSIFDSGEADVIVCDGFTGNIILKQSEAFYKLIKQQKIKNKYFEEFNFENYGGTPILGINASAIIGHGISNDIAIKNMIIHTYDVTKAKLSDKINKYLNNVKD